MHLLKKFSLIAFLAVLTYSCVKSDEETDSNAAITAFSLGQLYVLHNDITYEGTDTMLTTGISSGTFIYNIDNRRNIIFNTDTLPYGTLLDSVTVNITALGNPYFVTEEEDGTLTTQIWTTSLVLDFNRPLSLFVESTDGTFKRDYTIQTNIYTANPDSMTWQKLSCALPAGFNVKKAIQTGDSISVFGFDSNGQPSVTRHPLEGDKEWSGPIHCTGLSTGATFQSMTSHGGMLVILDEGKILVSEDGVDWSGSEPEIPLSSLMVIRQAEDYGTAWAVTADGWIASSTDLYSWVKVQEVPADFPTESVCCISYPLENNSSIVRYIISGTNPAYNEALFWTKLSTEETWTRIEAAANHSMKCPAFKGLKLFRYDGRLYACGGEGKLDTETIPAMQNFYESRDNGVSWKECSPLAESYDSWNNFMQIPSAYKGCTESFRCLTDTSNYIWFISTGTPGIWRGYINRLHK